MQEKNNFKKKYSKPPIKEVLCQFIFDKAINLDDNKIQDIKNTFKADFVSFELLQKKISNNDETIKVYKFSDKNNNCFLQISEKFFVINKLSPYTGWEVLKPVIKNSFEKLSSITGQRNILGIILKYTNLIKIELNEYDLSEYFNFYVHLPKEESNLLKFDVNIQTNTNTDNAILQIKMKSLNEKILLDFEYRENYKTQDINDILERAHKEIETNFEASITDKLRNLFYEEKENV